MSRKSSGGAAALAVGVLLLLPLLIASPANGQSFAEVTLTYVEEGEPCITATPDPVEIFWDKKPKKVKWVSASSKDLYWEITWKGSDDGQPNYFGQSFKIKRGENERRSDRPQRHGRTTPGANWAYTIKVYETSAAVERGRLLCELDPAVDWGD